LSKVRVICWRLPFSSRPMSITSRYLTVPSFSSILRMGHSARQEEALAMPCQPRSATRLGSTVCFSRRRTSRSGCTRAFCTTRSIVLDGQLFGYQHAYDIPLPMPLFCFQESQRRNMIARLPCQLRKGLGYGQVNQQVKASRLRHPAAAYAQMPASVRSGLTV
jgi:hypothetical protein